MNLQRPRGSALFFGMIIVALLASLALSFTSGIVTNTTREASDVAGTRAAQLAEAYVESQVQKTWQQYYLVRTDLRVATAYTNIHSDTAWSKFGEARVKCIQSAPDYTAGAEYIDIHYTAMAVVQSTTGTSAYGMRTVPRTVERVVRFGLGQAPVFDYVYFANNFGWMYGSTLYLYGNMGANGDLNFSGDPKVDGNLFAAKNTEIGADGIINGNAVHDSISQYQGIASSNAMMAPTSPAAPGVPFAAGYSGNQGQSTGQKPIDMPYLDLAMYKSLAKTAVVQPRADLGEPTGRTGGIIKQLKAPGLDPTDPNNYNVIVDQTYGFKGGEKGAYAVPVTDGQGNITSVSMQNFSQTLNNGNPESNGNLALIGTNDQPIVILGPVVISNDLVIKGTITGQGTFYTGRNIHVVGDVTYANPPQWSQNDLNVADTATANKIKDGAGFGAKGNIVLGDYTQASLSGGSGGDYWDYAIQYITPGFTHPYPVDEKDANLGYVSYMQDGKPWFNGDYTAPDGGSKFDPNLKDSLPRRFFESSFSNDYIASIATKPSKVQGIYYCNHYYGGRVNDYALYGADIMRDEAIVTDNQANFYYDPRITNGALNSYINLYLPRSSNYTTLLVHDISSRVLPQFADMPLAFGGN
jgi:hypothetical protein